MIFERRFVVSPLFLKLMDGNRLLLLFSLLLLPGLAVAQVNPDRIDASLLPKSVKAILGRESPITWNRIEVPDSVKISLQGKLQMKQQIPDTLFIGTVSTEKGNRYLIPDIAPSRSEQFSYVLYVDSAKNIVGVDVLTYRENYGYEIDYPFFRKQFEGKRQADKIIFGRTIQNISGATISARSITYSIHDLLLILNKIQLP